MITRIGLSRWACPFWVSTVMCFPGTIMAIEVPKSEPFLLSQTPMISERWNPSNAPGVTVPESMAQITSVSQLSDVQPTDWAFQALQSLVERYGCVAGYPDSRFRGQRALTRYEFAAGLNACLEQINQILNTAIGDEITREDLAILERLQEEFAAELETLQETVASLETRSAELETNQFSTTTKLSGLAWLNITGATASDGLQVETANLDTGLELRSGGRHSDTGEPLIQTINDNPETTFSELVWLTLTTSFSGEDQLVTTLAIGNGNSPANLFASAGLYNTFGTPFVDQSAGPNIGSTEIILRELFYQFPVNDSFYLVVGPRINFFRHFDFNPYTFFLSSGVSFNSINSTLVTDLVRGAGAVGMWEISDQLKFNFGYLGESIEFLPTAFFNSASDPRKGLFGATNILTAELTYSPTANTNLRLLYSRMNQDNNAPIFDEAGNLTGFGAGGATGGTLLGVADDGFGGSIHDAIGHALGFNFDWRVTSGFALFGRYTYGITNIEPKDSDRDDGTVNAQSVQFGFAFPDLGKTGAMGMLNVIVPFDVLNGRKFLVSGGGDGGTQYDLEATYSYPVTDGISLAPSVYWILNPNNFEDNPSILVGTMRAQFSF